MDRVTLGVEIGGTKLQIVLGTDEGRILKRIRGDVDPTQGAEGILEWLSDAIGRTLEEVPAGATVVGMGVGFGGPVERSSGRILTSHQVRGWDGIPLKHWLEDKFSLPTLVENDANAAGWAEFCLGAGRGTEHFVYCNIGSGIGGALIIDGSLYNGQGFGACEIGHTYVPDWTASSPGREEKLENLCSGWSISRRIRKWNHLAPGSPLAKECGNDPATLTCPMLAKAAQEGDPVALEEINTIARGIGCALTNVITLLHPERIALGGGVALMGDVLLDPLRAYVDTHVFTPYRKSAQVVPCELEEDVVTVGALLLAADLGAKA